MFSIGLSIATFSPQAFSFSNWNYWPVGGKGWERNPVVNQVIPFPQYPPTPKLFSYYKKVYLAGNIPLCSLPPANHYHFYCRLSTSAGTGFIALLANFTEPLLNLALHHFVQHSRTSFEFHTEKNRLPIRNSLIIFYLS